MVFDGDDLKHRDLSFSDSFHYSRTNACTVLHPLTWYLYFLVYKICGLFFASHKKEKITAKWILRQNGVYHNKTAYIINFSCEAMTTNFFVWCKDFAATDAKNIMYASLLWIWRLWGLRKWNKLSFFVCCTTKGRDYTFPWLYCCLTGGGSYRPLHPMHIELKFIGMPILYWDANIIGFHLAKPSTSSFIGHGVKKGFVLLFKCISISGPYPGKSVYPSTCSRMRLISIENQKTWLLLSSEGNVSLFLLQVMFQFRRASIPICSFVTFDHSLMRF